MRLILESRSYGNCSEAKYELQDVSYYKEILWAKMLVTTKTILNSFFANHRPIMEESELQAGPCTFQDTGRTQNYCTHMLLEVKIIDNLSWWHFEVTYVKNVI
jgi:hypothetical protein